MEASDIIYISSVLIAVAFGLWVYFTKRLS